MADDLDKQYPPETLLELGKLALRMSRNKDTRREFLKTVKKIAPDYQLPGDQQVEDLRHELEEKASKAEADRAANEVRTRLEVQRAMLAEGKLIPGKQFTPEQIKEIEEKVMPKYGISDYEGAAKIYLGDNKPPPQVGRPGSTTWTFPDIPGLFEDPTKAAREAANTVIDELHRGRGA
jgi:hypothetical protein